MKFYTTLSLGVLLMLVIQIAAASAQLYETNYNITGSGTQSDPEFVVQTLKYEPYPVSAGDWFDIWVKVQNIGQNDAKNARFELMPEYPFSSNYSTIVDFGIVPGTTSAYNNKQLGDTGIEANQVIMKFRVRVDESAPTGESILKLKATTNQNLDVGRIYTLPVQIGNTKTDFDVVMQDSTSQGTSFALANTGQNAATAVTVKIDDPSVKTIGASSAILGNLDKGEFTTITFQILPNTNADNLNMQISYTDASGVRNKIEKNVPVSINATIGQPIKASSGPSKYIYLVIGILIGFVLVFIYKKIRRKK